MNAPQQPGIHDLVARAKRQLDALYNTDPSDAEAFESAIAELESTLNLIDQAAYVDEPGDDTEA